MQRREFSKVAAALVAMRALGLERPGMAAAPGAKAAVAVGTNLSGMEWAKPGLRHGLSSAPNIHFTVPRKADVAYLADCGITKNRLPIQWELLQPMLHDTQADAAAKAAIGNPGEFHAGYASYITGLLDAHAAAGIRCIIDLHNYCRYQDFRYQANRAVVGLTAPPSPLMRPYTQDPAQVRERIFSLAEGATLKISHFVDFWQRAAERWKNHPGFGGYGLMNEPHDLPRPGTVVASTSGEDLTIWPAFAQAAIQAIRALDKVNPIYVAGNEWSSAMAMATKNPGFPLAGDNLIYEVHLYLDARSNGHAFDFDTEVAKKSSAGFGNRAIHANTGLDRLKMATDWAKEKGVRVALTEIGMPIDDARWAAMFRRTIDHARDAGCEVYTWMGGNHWPIHGYAINHAPGWHQNKTLEPLVSGVLKASAGIAQATLFSDGPAHGAAGVPVTIALYGRGNLARPLTLTVSAKGGGKLSRTQLTLPAGPNSQETFTYTPAANEVATLAYAGEGLPAGLLVPPPRKVFSLADPVAHAATGLPDAALAILAKYNACKWDLADGYSDYLLGAPAADGQPVRAVSDSGYGSSPGNAMEMINWTNTDSAAMGSMAVPVMRVKNGLKASQHAGDKTWGFWCKKTVPEAGIQPNPQNRVPYSIEDAHFALAVVSSASPNTSGLVFEASRAEASYTSELAFANGQPMARWVDAKGQTVMLASAEKLPQNRPAVLTFASAPGQQLFRVNSALMGSGKASFAPGVYNQMLIGWGFANYYPRDGFHGNIHAVVTGKGFPSAAELSVLERYLGRLAGAAAYA
ncbi:MAG: Twin-arginine translocation pathway signal [Polaromonas sp.]|nr:Twin-arginine translocation pathway signal [Polaromonas sp.]